MRCKITVCNRYWHQRSGYLDTTACHACICPDPHNTRRFSCELYSKLVAFACNFSFYHSSAASPHAVDFCVKPLRFSVRIECSKLCNKVLHSGREFASKLIWRVLLNQNFWIRICERNLKIQKLKKNWNFTRSEAVKSVWWKLAFSECFTALYKFLNGP